MDQRKDVWADRKALERLPLPWEVAENDEPVAPADPSRLASWLDFKVPDLLDTSVLTQGFEEEIPMPEPAPVISEAAADEPAEQPKTLNRDELQKHLPPVDEPPQPEVELRTTCPHCRTACALEADCDPEVRITCPNCSGRFLPVIEEVMPAKPPSSGDIQLWSETPLTVNVTDLKVARMEGNLFEGRQAAAEIQKQPPTPAPVPAVVEPCVPDSPSWGEDTATLTGAALARLTSESGLALAARPERPTATTDLARAPASNVQATLPEPAPDFEMWSEAPRTCFIAAITAQMPEPLEAPVTIVAPEPEPVVDPMSSFLEPVNLETASADAWDEEEAVKNGGRHLLITVGNGEYAVKVEDIVEVRKVSQITPLPRVPAWLRGVTYANGEVLSVVDLHWFLTDNPNTGKPGWLLVAGGPNRESTAGLLVDSVRGVFTLPAPKLGAGHADPVKPYRAGVCTFEKSKLVCLDLECLLETAEMRQFELV